MNNRVFVISSNKDLVLRRTGATVPEDEPMFVLRARDRKALATIRCYQSIFSPTSEQWKVVQNVIDDFAKFRTENETLMGEPDECY